MSREYDPSWSDAAKRQFFQEAHERLMRHKSRDKPGQERDKRDTPTSPDAQEPPETPSDDPGYEPEPAPNGKKPLGNGQTAHPLIWAKDVTTNLETQDFVQGLLVNSSLVVVYGRHSSGKTFFVTTLALSVAAGVPLDGRRVDQGGVLYCLMEAGVGFDNRVSLWLSEHGYQGTDLPFAVTKRPVNLWDDKDGSLDSFLAAARLAQDRVAEMGLDLKLIVIDTLARALAGGNENSPEDMGRLVANADLIRRETGACVILVHHAGKDDARGARGHSSLAAAIDTEIEVTVAEANHAVTVSKQRDLDTGLPIGFSLTVAELGQNQHGEPVTSCLVEFADQPPETRLSPLKGHAKRAYDILCDLVASQGRPGFVAGYPEIHSVPEDWWRERFYEQAMPGAKANTKQRTFRRSSDDLINWSKVAMRGGRVWIPGRTQPGQNDGHDPDKTDIGTK